MSTTDPMGGLSRRDFVAISSAAGMAAFVAPGARAAAAGDIPKPIKGALIGCGGRGSGAASQALKADPGVILWAAADVFPDRIDNCLKLFEKHPAKDRVQVPQERRFSGFDGYKKAIASGVDVVLLCSAPHFRPMHLAEAARPAASPA